MRRFPFDRLHHSARRQSRRHIQQQMHMIGSHMPLHDLDIQRSANLSRQIPHLFPDLSSQSRLAVLGDEHKVISQPIHCMRTFPILRHLRSVPPSLLKASPKGEGVHPSQSGTLREESLSITAKRVSARAGLRLGVSLSRSELVGITTLGELAEALKASAQHEREKADGYLGDSAIDRAIEEQYAIIENALHDREILKALEVAPGKELLGHLLRWTGCTSPSNLARSASKHLKPRSYDHLRRLCDSLTPRFPEALSAET